MVDQKQTESPSESSMTAGPCLVCGHVGFSSYLDILLKCPNCGFVTARPDSSIDVLSLYQSDYFTGAEYLDYLADEALHRKNFHARLSRLLRRRSSGRLLEIGSAYGFFLDLAKQYFEVVGYEVNIEAAQYARQTYGVDVRTDDFLQADISGPFDVTIMWDVIEHLERPDLFVKRIAELSGPGALMYVTTSDIGSFVARHRGPKWRMIHPPSHLHYFDRSTLARLLADYGFRVIETQTVGTARSLRQILYSILVLRMKMPGLYHKVKCLIRPGWGLTVNTFDIMLVTAEKRGC
ncbi:MAG: class I SAM-dependent methyltransferase [Planctomycetota bacterium]|nr:MAG: class I SAM-dependent methyltransferase [Planctomycetota bacterium]